MNYIFSTRGRKFIRSAKFWTAVFVVSGLSLIAAASHSPLFAQSNLDEFEITDYKINYVLGIDDEKRSILSTSETITAHFPVENRNRGILREIPHVYDDHEVDLKIDSVEDEQGRSVEYTVETKGRVSVLRIGDPDRFVYGSQVYRIKYSQRDVTKTYLDSTGSDEFYWDTNGTGWRVPIQRLSVAVSLDNNLDGSLTGEYACYIGLENSNHRCDLEYDKSKFQVSHEKLSPGENITLAIGFESGTFNSFEPGLWDKYLNFVQSTWLPAGLVSIVFLIYASYRWVKLHWRKGDVGTIVNQFVPPEGLSISAVSFLYGKSHVQYTTQLLDLAVRGYIQIIETKPQKSWISQAEHDIEIKNDLSNLLDEEREVVSDLFYNKSQTMGSRIGLQKVSKSKEYISRRMDDVKNIQNAIDGRYKFRQRDPELSRWFKISGLVVILLSAASLNAVAGLVAVIVLVYGFTLKPFTDRGLEVYVYLKGLERYMKVAEKDRINYLHSPEGVERIPTGIDIDNPEHLIKLSEKLLPYAVLFGIEKDWVKELAVGYQSTGDQPSWISGVNGGGLNSVALIGAVQGFTASAAYSSDSSSSSGGSTGGGYSGGGGGGGGGGGW